MVFKDMPELTMAYSGGDLADILKNLTISQNLNLNCRNSPLEFPGVSSQKSCLKYAGAPIQIIFWNSLTCICCLEFVELLEHLSDPAQNKQKLSDPYYQTLIIHETYYYTVFGATPINKLAWHWQCVAASDWRAIHWIKLAHGVMWLPVTGMPHTTVSLLSNIAI